MFETEKEVLEWYEKQPRVLNGEFLKSFPWDQVKDFELCSKFIPVLFYMRDIEHFTDIYYKELLRTSTGRDPVLRRFMDRWSVEENEHGELLNRFLEEAGVDTESDWQQRAKSKIPYSYKISSLITSMATFPFGKHFAGTHMLWGTINEMTTLQGYRRLWHLANHPILEKLLRAIAREESIHAKFYWSIARLRLERSEFSRKLARFAVSRFWSPVGQGIKPVEETNYTVVTLFRGIEGFDFFMRNVNSRILELPGFNNFDALAQKVSAIVV